MNSKERKIRRYNRRRLKREANRNKRYAIYDNYANVISANSLIKSAIKSRRTIRFKSSVQRYFMSLLKNIWKTRNDLIQCNDVRKGFIEFVICDRGKTRNIRSVHFYERVVQRSLCDNALIPMLAPSLIYDNGASLPGKGPHFAINRAKKHLQSYFRENGFNNKGWVLFIDFSSYFDNIQHIPVKDVIYRVFKNEKMRLLIWRFVEAFGEESLGIGSQVSQILALVYPNKADHFAKEILRLKYYGRYMDDTYIIHNDKHVLENALKNLKNIYDELGIKLNSKKTRIVPLNKFVFMKIRFILTRSGKVILKPIRKNITNTHRKLRKLKNKYDNGEIERDDINCMYQSHRGYIKSMEAIKIMLNTDKLFKDLFGKNEGGKENESIDLY